MSNFPLKTIVILVFSSIFIFGSSAICFGQKKYEYLGVIKLNGKTQFSISYKLNFTESKGLIKGHSLTDIGGSNETKSTIIGSFNKKTKSFTFRETSIVYTKSALTKNDFCYVHFKGKLTTKEKKGEINGLFKGLYPDSTKCVNGTVKLIGAGQLNAKISKISKKIAKSKKVDQKTKDKLKLKSIIDSLSINQLIKDEDLKITWKSSRCYIELSDPQKEDGDEFDIYLNDSLILSNYKVAIKPKKIFIKIGSNKNRLKIVAKNTGSIASATMKIILYNKSQRIELITRLWLNEEAFITFL